MSSISTVGYTGVPPRLAVAPGLAVGCTRASNIGLLGSNVMEIIMVRVGLDNNLN